MTTWCPNPGRGLVSRFLLRAGSSLLTSVKLRQTGELKSGSTKLQREVLVERADSPILIENEQKLVPVHGLPLAIGAQRRGRTKGRRRGRAKRGRKGAQRTGLIPRLPPAITTTVPVAYKIRCVNTSIASGTLFTRASLALSMGCIVTVANTTVRGIIGSYRLVRITGWPAASGNIDLSWNVSGGAEMALTKDTVKNQEIPSGITSTGGMVWAPPKNTILGDWQVPTINGTDQICQISATSGSVFDFEFVGTLANQYAGVSGTVASGTLATFLYLPPDGPTTHLFQPRGLPTGF